MTHHGVRIERVERGSPADRAGLRAGMRLLRIDGGEVRDALELYFRESRGRLRVEYLDAEGAARTTRVDKAEDDPVGVTLEPTKDLACKERCVFCFVHQNPKGLRRSLYFKDDDYRLSFLHGNFVTLTNAPEGAIDRIIEQKLSPLYISIHTTDPVLRGRLLGSRGPAPILPILDRLRDGGIRFYAQIVLCPGWNGGLELTRTLRDLLPYHPDCLAVAVVPLGLTEHRRGLPALAPFERRDAEQCLTVLSEVQSEARRRVHTSFAFAGDEIYLRAGASIPPAAHYEDFPMIEDGVGMWRSFVDGWERASRRGSIPAGPGLVLVTGTLFAPTLRRLAAALSLRSGRRIKVVAVGNRLFGASITVTGLLSGRCVLAALEANPPERDDIVVVPGNLLNQAETEGAMLLDGETIAGIEAKVARRVVCGGRTPDSFFQAVRQWDHGTRFIEAQRRLA